MSAPAATGEKKIDWERACAALDERGFAVLSGVLTKKICQEILGYYADDHRFRSRIEMSRYSFGQGEYKYFNYPLPPIVQQLRSSIYPHLAALANRWGGRLGRKLPVYPETLTDYLEQCHRAGQNRSTPLLLKYGVGDFNCLHQDLYGDSVFPFQLTFFLSQRGS
ncbi:MAG TPA: 2OG-Fe(II) oxygenase, partial [Candidatus Binatia bacterium]|nr:2OG-Fe(II) oxygenase [Candidatus Binatia bacterium]